MDGKIVKNEIMRNNLELVNSTPFISPAGGDMGEVFSKFAIEFNMYENSNYNKYLKNNANKLRKNMTKAEACLWKYVLSKKQMSGFQFRRQRPVYKYIVDFLSKDLFLIIEVDGITHHNEKVFQKDKLRERELTELGYKILRFKDVKVLTNIEGVRKKIEMEIEKIKQTCPPLAEVSRKGRRWT